MPRPVAQFRGLAASDLFALFVLAVGVAGTRGVEQVEGLEVSDVLAALLSREWLALRGAGLLVTQVDSGCLPDDRQGAREHAVVDRAPRDVLGELEGDLGRDVDLAEVD